MKIEKEIPVPFPTQSRGRKIKPQNAELHRIVSQLKVGESFIAPAKYINDAGIFWPKQQLARKYFITLAQRKTEDGIRIWRTA